MSYQVSTRVFEGPLDLLLQLITSHQVDITDLSLSLLVGEYLEHLEAIREMDVDVTSEFLLIAATLIQLKARYLLPGRNDLDLDEELALQEERDRLLARLLACLTFKDVAAVLEHRMTATARFMPRSVGLDPGITPPPAEMRIGVDADGLAAVARAVFTRKPDEPDVDHLELDLPSVGDAIADLRMRLSDHAVTEFDALVEHCRSPGQVIAYFLALLELSRWGIVRIDQADAISPIAVRHDPEAPVEGLAALGSEW